MRLWSVATQSFHGEDGALRRLQCVKLDWSAPDERGTRTWREIPGTGFEVKAELVLLAMGFLRVEHGPLVTELELATDEKGNLKVGENFMTSSPGVFAAGDAITGASLVVRAIDLGRLAAAAIDCHLSG
jgi:NADPH-dependent glutamate synthase beta subunit-like oxidoreductase